MSLILISGPGGYPLSLADAKLHLKVDSSEEDDAIDQLIAGAVEHLDGDEGWLNRALVDQTWELTLDRFPAGPHGEIEIPLPPLIEIISVIYLDDAGDEQTLAAATGYQLIPRGKRKARLRAAYDTDFPATRRTPDAVRIRFRAGYAQMTADSPPEVGPGVPAPIITALKWMVGDLYAAPETFTQGAVAETPTALRLDDLLYPLRIGGIA